MPSRSGLNRAVGADYLSACIPGTCKGRNRDTVPLMLSGVYEMNECPICKEIFGHAPGCPRGAEEEADEQEGEEEQ